MVRYTHALTKKEHFRQTEERLLKVQFNRRTGYKFHQLYLEKKMYNRNIHILVADAFLKSEEGKHLINHKDGNKHNNRVDNLERCTNEYNHEHATKTGLKAKGVEIGTSKLTDQLVSAIKCLCNQGISHGQIAKAFGVSRSSISLIHEEKTWKHVTLSQEKNSL